MSRASYAGVDQGPKPVTVAATQLQWLLSVLGARRGAPRLLPRCDLVQERAPRLAQREARRRRHLTARQRRSAISGRCWRREGRSSRAMCKALQPLLSDNTVTHVGRGEVVYVDDAQGRRKAAGHAGCRWAAERPLYRLSDLPHAQPSAAPARRTKSPSRLTTDPTPPGRRRFSTSCSAANVKACFFLLGKNAEEHPGLVRRIVDEGHEIGNHTYSHQNLAQLSEIRMRLELNMTQRVIESITGRSTTLFRPPYNADSNPASIEELLPLKIAQDDLGYTVVLERIDPQDWARPRRPRRHHAAREGPAQGGEHRAAARRRRRPLADRGGAAAHHRLPPRRAATTSCRISTLLNIPRDDLMPPVNGGAQSIERIVSSTGFQIWRVDHRVLLGVHDLRHGARRRCARSSSPGSRTGIIGRVDGQPIPLHTPPVSIVIAAFNEGKVIAKTLRSRARDRLPRRARGNRGRRRLARRHRRRSRARRGGGSAHRPPAGSPIAARPSRCATASAMRATASSSSSMPIRSSSAARSAR